MSIDIGNLTAGQTRELMEECAGTLKDEELQDAIKGWLASDEALRDELQSFIEGML